MSYLTIGDINIYCEMRGKGEPIVFIHGLGSSTQDWEHQTKFFEKNYAVIAYDQRGHGKTDKPKGPYSVKLFAADAANLIKQLGKGPVHVVGNSLGGMVAFQLVVDYPEVVKSLTIINSGPAVIFPTRRTRIAFFFRGVSVKLFGMRVLSKTLAKNLYPKPEQEHLRKTFIQRWQENDPKAYFESLKVFSNWNLLDRLGEIKCPTLVISADKDYTPVSLKQEYVKLIPNAELVVIPDSRHMTVNEQPEALNQAMAAFLRRISGSV